MAYLRHMGHRGEKAGRQNSRKSVGQALDVEYRFSRSGSEKACIGIIVAAQANCAVSLWRHKYHAETIITA